MTNFNIFGTIVKSLSAPNKFTSMACLASVALLAGSPAAESADSNRLSAANKGPQNVESEFHFQELKKYEALPDLPNYSGQADFVHGVIYPQARGGNSTTCTLVARESKDTVLRWYQDALKMYRWNTGTEQSTDGVRGFKGGNFVQIMLSPASKRGYGCNITITYRTTVQ